MFAALCEAACLSYPAKDDARYERVHRTGGPFGTSETEQNMTILGQRGMKGRLAKIGARIRKSPITRVGPGLITGVADDDPSGIATYSHAGATFGLDMLWTMPLAFPLMAAIQLVCARIGRVTGRGLAANIKTAFPAPVLLVVTGLLLLANTLNIAADIAAMGDVTSLVTGLNKQLAAIFWVIVTLVLQVFVPYHRYVYFLKWLTLSLLSYFIVAMIVHVPWHDVAMRTIWPHVTWDGRTAEMVLGVFGTTISPYLFFWQASEEVEDLRIHHAEPLLTDDMGAAGELRRISWDTWSGMFYSDVTAYFIILATAVTLHAHGVTRIETAAQAADALRPLAGDFAYYLFAVGIWGVGLIGVPVLAGSAAYGFSEAMNWQWGLERKATDARGFYGVIIVSVLAALVIQFSPLSPMKALFWCAVLNGVVAAPLMAILLLLGGRRLTLGKFVVSKTVLALGWIATFVMAVSTVEMVLGWF